MKIRRVLLILATLLLLSCFLTGCEAESVRVNVGNETSIYGTVFGKDALVGIGGGLWYDSTTRIVYWWNGFLNYGSYAATTPSPYYAPNGLPYRYNPETNTFEEICDE